MPASGGSIAARRGPWCQPCASAYRTPRRGPRHQRGFSRHLHRLSDVLDELFATFGPVLKYLPTGARYGPDSFPVPVCPNTRIGRSKLPTGKTCRGRSARKRGWFYGVKVQVIATADALPVASHIHTGREADTSGRRQLDPNLPAGSVLYTDAAHTAFS